MVVMMTNSLSDRLAAWTEQNPLRRWRMENGVKAAHAALQMRVSNYTLRLWETGSSTPTGASFDKMRALVGRDMRTEWDAWESSRPE